MAKKTTNDAKRAEMKNIMAGVFEKGWKPNEIAAVIGVTPSNISSWKAGKNMGTNAARAALAALPGRNTSFAKDMLDAVLASAQKTVDAMAANVEEVANDFDKCYRSTVQRRDFEVGYHTDAIAQAHAKAERARNGDASAAYYIAKSGDENESSYDWDVRYHTDGLNEANAKTEADLIAEAKETQESGVLWSKKRLADATKTLNFIKKVAAKW